MKKVFTLALVMAMAVTSFAQVKSSKKSVKPEPAQTQIFKGTEGLQENSVVSTRSIMARDGEIEAELSYTTYDWQTNAAQRNFTAVWPDGYAVMCYTLATTSNFSDRGTGLAIWDPAVGEWEYTETRVEGVKTGFGSIARYKENGLVVAAHTASDLRIFMVEDFREGNREFGEGIVFPAPAGADPCWPVVQCSGANLDIIHVLCTNNGATTPYKDPIVYYRYENGEWTHQCEIIPNLDENNASDCGSNVTYFMEYNPARPNQVSFILNNAWSDGKLVVSNDNGDNWTDKVFYQHPGINTTFESSFLYPRWVDAMYDVNGKLHIVYEYNGSTGEPGSGSYYPSLGAGVCYWSEVLPKNEMCLGGIGEVGQPFIMDSTYISQDIYGSHWWWSDANHESLPECFGQLEMVDDDGNVVPDDGSGEIPEGAHWVRNSTDLEHGAYNCGIASMPSMYMDNNFIVSVWSMIAGDDNLFIDGNSRHYFRLFYNMSYDGGLTWEGTQALITDFMYSYSEMVYGQIIPYIYTDSEGHYLWYVFQTDGDTGTFVQSDETDESDNLYMAYKLYVDYNLGVEEPTLTVAPTINVYPNPAQGSFSVNLTNESNVNIYNTVGQLVKTFSNVKEVNVNLEAGVYFVNAGKQTVKVIVK